MTNQIPKRRWYQYSLRSLLLLMVLCAIACSWFAVKMQRVRRQREVVKAIVEAGGSVGYDYELNAGYYGTPEPPGPAWMRKLLGENFFAKVGAAWVTNEDGLGHLKKLTDLHHLSLGGPQITDESLKHLEGLSNLKELYLRGTQVTDEAVEELKRALPNCKSVHLE